MYAGVKRFPTHFGRVRSLCLKVQKCVQYHTSNVFEETSSYNHVTLIPKEFFGEQTGKYNAIHFN
jgi:hypothetical protein